MATKFKNPQRKKRLEGRIVVSPEFQAELEGLPDAPLSSPGCLARAFKPALVALLRAPSSYAELDALKVGEGGAGRGAAAGQAWGLPADGPRLGCRCGCWYRRRRPRVPLPGAGGVSPAVPRRVPLQSRAVC